MGASFTPGRRCPPDQRSLSGRRLPLPNGQPYTPLKPPTGGVADNGAYKDSLAFTRPAFPSPVAPGWNGNASAFSWASHPAVTHNARQDGDGPLDTGPDHTFVKRPPLSVTTHYVRPHVARLPSAPIESLRRLDGGVLSPPHGHEAPRGARFPCSARMRPGWIGVSSVPRGRRCSRDRSVVLGRRLPPLNGVVPPNPGDLARPRVSN